MNTIKPKHYYKRLLKRAKSHRSKMRRDPAANKSNILLINQAIPVLVDAARHGSVAFSDERRIIKDLTTLLGGESL